jgi:hypothetical protein
MTTSAPTVSASAPLNGSAPHKPNPIRALDKIDTISGVMRDFGKVLVALKWDPKDSDHLHNGDVLDVNQPMNGLNRVYTSAQVFAACETAWGKRPGASSKDPAWQAFDSAVGRVQAQARRAHLLMGADGVVRDSPEEAAAAAKVRGEAPRTRAKREEAESPIRDGQLFGQVWQAATSKVLVAALGGRMPGRDQLAAALVSCGWVLVRDEASGITTIELPRPKELTATQKASIEKAVALEKKASALEADVPEAAAACREAAKKLRAAVDLCSGSKGDEVYFADGRYLLELAASQPAAPAQAQDPGPAHANETASDAAKEWSGAPLPSELDAHLRSLAVGDLRDAANAIRKWIPEGTEHRPTSKELKGAGQSELVRITVSAYERLSDEDREKLIADVLPGVFKGH